MLTDLCLEADRLRLFFYSFFRLCRNKKLLIHQKGEGRIQGGWHSFVSSPYAAITFIPHPPWDLSSLFCLCALKFSHGALVDWRLELNVNYLVSREPFEIGMLTYTWSKNQWIVADFFLHAFMEATSFFYALLMIVSPFSLDGIFPPWNSVHLLSYDFSFPNSKKLFCRMPGFFSLSGSDIFIFLIS